MVHLLNAHASNSSIMPLMNTYLYLVLTYKMLSWLYLFYNRHRNLRKVSFESWGKKTFACAIFGKICYVACVINPASKLICLYACLHGCDRFSNWQARIQTFSGHTAFLKLVCGCFSSTQSRLIVGVEGLKIFDIWCLLGSILFCV